jgi:hypothetical protein
MVGSASKPEKEYISVAGIKAEFHVTSMIIKRLGEPDLLVDNPHYKCAPQMKLYKRARVEQLVKSLKVELPGFMARMGRRQERANRAVATKQRSMDKLASELVASLVIQPYNAADIPTLAEQQHALHEIDVYGDVVHTWEGGFGAEVAYIRHNLTNYHEALDRIRGRVGAGAAYESIKKALNDRINEDYSNKIESKGIIYGRD